MIASTRTLRILLMAAMMALICLGSEQNSLKSGDTYRAMIYAQSESRIRHFNELYGEYYTSAHNQFSELTPEEFAATYLGGGMSEEGSIARMHVAPPTQQQKQSLKTNDQFPNLKMAAGALINDIVPSVFSIDYTLSSSLMVTPVKSMGACGATYAFAVLGTIESFYMKNHNLWLDLSQQQIVDCLPLAYSGNLGCAGGMADSVFYYATLYPIALEKYYPYASSDGANRTCSQAKINSGPTFLINSYVYNYDCLSLASALLGLNPVMACAYIDVQWQSYASGVISNCNASQLGLFCFMVVGASSDGSLTTVNGNYWKIKVSWGPSYGESGFVRVYRDPTDKANGFCKICKGFMYPV